MIPPMHASHPARSGAPHTSPSAALPDPFFHATLDEGTLDEVFDMIRAPNTVVVSQAASYRAGRDQRLDPSSSAFVPSLLPFQGMGYTVSDFATSPAQYETPPAYYDFLNHPVAAPGAICARAETTSEMLRAAQSTMHPTGPQQPSHARGLECCRQLFLRVRGIRTIASRETKLPT
ncbi:hypothetical protein PIB30_099614 [Stylosanthes scabra]|uniref:Uncharacterized protein n=1 Tax=Stylosanthes scabra TaxID=79078 RepID=A0ABU6RWW2_9FABA|nr:hypothetical protein [Stylosanthes scabra]